VIIVLHRIYQLNRSQQQRLMHDFWIRLVRQIGDQERRSWRSHLILFLTQDDLHADTHLDQVKLLELLEITHKDVQCWLSQDDIFQQLEQLHGADCVAQLVQHNVLVWNTNPWSIFENICEVFGEDIAAIEPYWKLVG
jgi:hypothetical protein